MTGYLTQVGVPVLNQVLTAIPGMTLASYLQSVQLGVLLGTLNPTFVPPTVNTPGVDNVLSDTVYLAEHHLYGSSRLGIKTYDTMQYYMAWLSGPPPGFAVSTLDELIPWYSGGYADWIKNNKVSPVIGSTYNLSTAEQREVRNLGRKQYELTDHLGNVLATVLDRKSGYGNTSGLYTGFNANLASVSDYYPFGFGMVDRTKEFSNFEFGYNGQMKTDEVYGKGNLNTALFWEMDTRIGRRWNLDPVDQINISNYAVNRLNPIFLRDPKGDDPITGVIEALSSFAISAGMDFMTGWLIEGKSASKAFDDIGWWSAGWDAAKSYALASVTPPGTATARKIIKIANSKAGKLTIGIMEKMTTKVVDNYSKGNYDDDDHEFNFNKLKDNLSDLFWESTIETLIEEGLGSKAEEVMGTLKRENRALANKLSKLRNKIENGESLSRVMRYSKKVVVQGQKTAKAAGKVVTNKVKEKAASGTAAKLINNKRKELQDAKP